MTEGEESSTVIVDTDFVRNTATEAVVESAVIRLNGGGTDVLRSRIESNVGFNVSFRNSLTWRLVNGAAPNIANGALTLLIVCFWWLIRLVFTHQVVMMR